MFVSKLKSVTKLDEPDILYPNISKLGGDSNPKLGIGFWSIIVKTLSFFTITSKSITFPNALLIPVTILVINSYKLSSPFLSVCCSTSAINSKLT